jgi:hypothetical protein
MAFVVFLDREMERSAYATESPWQGVRCRDTGAATEFRKVGLLAKIRETERDHFVCPHTNLKFEVVRLDSVGGFKKVVYDLRVLYPSERGAVL